jgi:hypothetical protein
LEQYGFKENSSAELAIFNLTNQILIQNNKKLAVSGIFCDLTEAFDTVNHHLLIIKLKHYGIIGKSGDSIKSYLSNRYQRVFINSWYSSNKVSRWEQVKHGVPQGSIPGPLLFLLYINDIPQQVQGLVKPIPFADDTSFIISNIDPQLMFHEVKITLEIIQNLFNSNKMLLNYKKTKLIQCFPNMSHERMDFIEHNANKISAVNSIKFLGVIIDSH